MKNPLGYVIGVFGTGIALLALLVNVVWWGFVLWALYWLYTHQTAVGEWLNNLVTVVA